MPRESLGFVRMVWYCPNCQSKNPGNFRFCRGCGAAMPVDIQFQKDDKDELITDAKEIERAKLGADIHCGYCGARNPADAKNCVACSADMATGKRREQGTVTGALQTAPVADVACPNCATPNPANSLTCKACGAPLQGKTAPKAPAAKSMPRWLPFLLAGLLIACLLLVFMLTRTTGAGGTVSQINWERSIDVLALAPVERQDWKPEIPADAELGSCEERLYRTSDQPEARSQKVCGTPYTVDKGNGYSEVVQDCQYEVYEDYCSYTVMDWTVVSTHVASGVDNNPVWPQESITSEQKYGDQHENYQITFETDDGEKIFTTSNEELFIAARPGTRWNLEINTFGSIVNISPAE